ncbi:MAG TPA: alr0857 family protein [Stenomitos sp.]
MLKLTYTESGLRLERLGLSLEVWIAQRVTLMLRAGQKLYVEPSTASFLLDARQPGLLRLEKLLSQEYKSRIAIAPAEAGMVEVSLPGSWIAECSDAHEGLFVTGCSDAVELCLYRLWHVAQKQASFLALE